MSNLTDREKDIIAVKTKLLDEGCPKTGEETVEYKARLIRRKLEELEAGTAAEYVEFSWVRLVVNAVKCWRQIAQVAVGMVTAEVYTSCKISGGDVGANIQRSKDRAVIQREKGRKVLNPVDCGVVGAWSGQEYMWMWTKVIWLMNKRGCVLRVHSEDLKTSRGCNLELLQAVEMGMKTEVWSERDILDRLRAKAA